MYDKHIDAAVYNFAFGDAWGYVTEFKKFEEIQDKQYPVPSVLKVSDDTQMGIYTMKTIEILRNSGMNFDNMDFSETHVQDTIRNSFANSYLAFYFDEDNNRAPGMTCMKALEAYYYSARKTGFEGGSKNNSLGCGTIMRTPWIGLLPYKRESLVNLSILHSQTTHGDPAGWISSAILTLMINDFMFNEENTHETTSNMFSHALDSLHEIKNMNLSLLNGYEKEFNMLYGQLSLYLEHWDEINSVLPEMNDNFIDLNKIFGEGWIATETLYNALAAVNFYSEESSESIYRGVKRLVYTNGDSDSIAAVGGSLWGVKSGLTPIPVEQIQQKLEKRYREELENLVDFINHENQTYSI